MSCSLQPRLTGFLGPGFHYGFFSDQGYKAMPPGSVANLAEPISIKFRQPHTGRHYTRSISPPMKSRKRPRKYRYTLRHDRHSVSLLTDHLVFCTKYRKTLLTPKIAKRCEEIIRSVAEDLDVTLFRMAVNEDHVHIFMRYPPKLSISYITMKFKSVSSILLRREFPELKKAVRDHLWAPSNYHGSVGQGFDVVDNYVKGQKRRHGN